MFLHKITLPDGQVLDSNAIRSVTLTEQINDQTDLCPGAACAACAEIELWAPENALQITQGDELTLIRINTESGAQEPVGVFLAEKPEKTSANVIRLTAYDRMTLLDKDLSPWLREQQDIFPVSLADFIPAVCARCGVTLAADALTDLPNGSYSIQAFYADSLTGRQLIQWAAQAACRFARMTPAGQLTFGWFTDTGRRLLPRDYLQGSLRYEDYQTAPIDKVQIRQSDSDVGVLYPPDAAGTNALVIQGNLLLTAESAETLRPVAQALYTLLQGVRYTPLSVDIYPAADLPAPGSILQVQDAWGRTMTTWVMQRTLAGQKTTLAATGNPRRDSTTAVNSARLENLRGKMLEIQADIGQLTIKASDLSGDFSQMQQSVDSLSLGVTSTNQYSDILGNAQWVELYGGGASVSDNVLTLTGTNQETGASLYVPAGNLTGLAGKRIRITFEYKVLETIGGADFDTILWYVYQTEAGGGWYVKRFTKDSDQPPTETWQQVSWELTLESDIVTKLQFQAKAGANGYGQLSFRNVKIEAVSGVQSSINLSKDGVVISTSGLGEYATATDYTALKLEQQNLSLTVVKDGQVRSAFAADASSVTISSGLVTFAANTLVVDSDNFKLNQDGTVQISGTFTSDTGIDRAYIGSGQLHIQRKTSDGIWKNTVWAYGNGNNSAMGNLQLYGEAADGTQVPMLSAGASFAGANLYMFRSDKSAFFSCYPDASGNPYFALSKPGGASSGRWMVDSDGRGHLITPIVELEKLTANGITHTPKWVYFSSLGRTVLCGD